LAPYSDSHAIVSIFGCPGAGIVNRSARLVYPTHSCAKTARTSSTTASVIIEATRMDFSFAA
jgi:hypothetical protein